MAAGLETHNDTPWELKLFIDGACPLCSRERDMLARLDRGRGKLAFEDITNPEFDPHAYGLTAEEVNDQIHGVTPEGDVLQGMEVFRRAYGAVGFGWLLAPTRWPGLKQLSDCAYHAFARNRLRLTGRCHGGACSTE